MKYDSNITPIIPSFHNEIHYTSVTTSKPRDAVASPIRMPSSMLPANMLYTPQSAGWCVVGGGRGGGKWEGGCYLLAPGCSARTDN